MTITAVTNAIAVTGHRPPKLFRYDERLVDFAKKELEELKPSLILTGMALGWDMAIAEAAYSLSIPFNACIPFGGQELRWPEASQFYYRSLCKQAKEIIIVGEGSYAAWKMLKRDEFMVDNAPSLLALYNGDEKGGTAHTVKYATKKHKPINNCWERWLLYCSLYDAA